ncbi:MAG: AAA family ATPase [Magnetococcus sp. YQC-5]
MSKTENPVTEPPGQGSEVRQPANSDSNSTDNSARRQQIDRYLNLGWPLILIPPGGKGPNTCGWNREENCITTGQSIPTGMGVGLPHAYAGTMALDIDDWGEARRIFADQGIDLDALFAAPDAVTINSGVEGHAKLLYALPSWMILPTKKITFKDYQGDIKTAFEFRCATRDGLTVQDVLPPSIHPVTGKPYQWGGQGSFERLPMIPMEPYLYWLSMVQKEDGEKPTTISCDRPTAELGEVRQALNATNPSLGRDDWVTVGMALHQYGTEAGDVQGMYTLWDTWSQGSKTKYASKKDTASVWKSFRAEDGVTIASLFHIAGQHGWTRPPDDLTGKFLPIKPIKTRAAPAKGSTTYSHRELMRRQFEDVAFLVAGLLTQGVYILGGKPKVGKSWLALHLLLCVAYGLRVFGSLAVTKGLALYISLEDHDRRLWKRVRQVCQQEPTDDLHFATEWSRIGQGCVEQLDEWLTDHPGTKLVIIDTLARIKPPRGKSGDIYAEDYGAVSAFKEISEKHGITVILVHHLRKMTSDDPADMLSGTTGLAGGVDGTLILIKPRNSKTLILHRSGRDLSDDEPLSLDWNKETGEWRSLDAGEAAIQYLTEEQKVIMDILRKFNVPMSRKDIAERAMREPDDIKRPMDALMKKGMLIKSGPYHNPFYSIKNISTHGEETNILSDRISNGGADGADGVDGVDSADGADTMIWH